MKQIERATMIATIAHEGQKRWGGEPYITHPLAVANSLNNMYNKIVAILHDVLEDTYHTRFSLSLLGIDNRCLDSLELLTHKHGISYYDYIHNIADSGNYSAIVVKIADIKHNSQSLLKYNKKDKHDKYMFALDVLKAAL